MKRRSAVILVLLTLTADVCFAAPSYDEVRARYASSDAILLDRNGDVIHELRVDPNGRRLQWVELKDISPALVRAVVGSEDKRFYQHHGADWAALASAAVGKLFSDGRRGASTITMQLVAMLDGTLRQKGRRSLSQKWKQIEAARELEQHWSKGRILEAYLNLVSFRGELQGIAAASRGIFGKEAVGLDEAESAILAALIRSPNAAPEKVDERAQALARALGMPAVPEQIAAVTYERLSKPLEVKARINLAPHVAHRLLRPGTIRAESTLDARVQRFAADSLMQSVSALSGQNVHDGAVLVVENRTGEVLAYVGNSGRLSSAPYVDGIRAPRQAGSTLKPFLYGLAIERRLITAASLIDDEPIDLPTGRGIYRPANYDREFHGVITARTALASSMNIPAVKTLGLVGTDAFVRKLREYGFVDLAEPEHYGPSLALGAADVTLWELVNAYRVIANKGIWSRMKLSRREVAGPEVRIMPAETAFIISDILADREARSATFSLENLLATRYWTAVKTGTSKDMRDNWCVGYSDRYTIGVWMGNFSGAPMWDVSGVTGAAPVWNEIMNYLHRSITSMAPKQPPGVVLRIVAFGGNERSSRYEWFLAGTEQEIVKSERKHRQPKIIYPAPDTVIALDPDIPADLQKVFFSVTPGTTLLLDGESIPAMRWPPVSGSHRLTLIGEDGTVADRLDFEVR